MLLSPIPFGSGLNDCALKSLLLQTIKRREEFSAISHSKSHMSIKIRIIAPS